MIKKLLIFAFLGLCFTGPVLAQSSMTDEQVLEYVQQGLAKGKDQNTLIKELSLRGVTRAQAERVKKLYESKKGSSKNSNATANTSRNHTTKNDSIQSGTDDARYNDVQSNKKWVEKFQPAKEKRADDMDPLNSRTQNDKIEEEETNPEYADGEEQIFGRDIFRNHNLNFAPSESLATPKNYRLGPGDEVVIDIYGANQTTLRDEISPEGSITVDVLGPVYLNGMTVDEANNYLKKHLAGIYAGLKNGEEAPTDIRLTLGQIRTIQINVLGEVVNPGTYTLSSFSTVFHALYTAGGVKGVGTLRNIKVNRSGRTIATVDVYDFLINGSRKSDIRLEEGDVILVPPYTSLVEVKGRVKRPMFFEMKKDESLSRLLTYAGGFGKAAYTKDITIIRQTGKDYEVRTVDEADYATFAMKDGDEVEVGELISRFTNRIKIEGAVYRPGLFQLSGQLGTVKALIEKADGLLPEAFTSRAILHREKSDKSLEVLSVDVAGIMAGTSPDVTLRNNDVLFIPSIYDLKDQGTLSISGAVASPGIFPFAANTTLEDLIIQAGGLLESASTVQVDVARRVKNQTSKKAQKEIAETYSFGLKNGFVVDGEQGFVLQPYDEVYVRTAPSYVEQRHIEITGEVNFIGQYALTDRSARLSDMISKAGGVTDFAYVRGARLVRTMTPEEQAKMLETMQSLTQGGDSLNLKTKLGSTYFVGIDLEKALANPGGDYDVVLRDGDRIEVPTYSNTVKISGGVLSPNTVTYMKQKTVKAYIAEAGGYAQLARKHKVYVIQMNGHITKGRKSSKVEPGSEVVVPTKAKSGNGLQEFMSIATTATSLATMLATITNLIK